MQAFIHYHEMWFPIPQGNLVRIGSAAECDIRLPHDPHISRHHCSVSFLNEELTVVDLRSSNGTHVNGIMLNGKPVSLNDGDSITLGSTELSVTVKQRAPLN